MKHTHTKAARRALPAALALLVAGAAVTGCGDKEYLVPPSSLEPELQKIAAGRESAYTIAISANVSYAAGVTLAFDRPVTITLKSAGKSPLLVVLKEGGPLFTVGNNATLTLTNITLGGSSSRDIVKVVDGGKLIIENGATIKNCKYGVLIDGASAKATMDGGSISGNSYGVYISGGVFIMNGGSISGNSRQGVYIEKKSSYTVGYTQDIIFTMRGGSISGNGGGGVYISGGEFTMRGGAISGNKNGGVDVGNGTFTMDGGAISGNTASSGGGVYLSYNSTFKKERTGGTISDNTATQGATYGHAVFWSANYPSSQKYRDTAVGSANALSTEDPDSGWSTK